MKAKQLNFDNFYNIWDYGHQHLTRVNQDQIQTVYEPTRQRDYLSKDTKFPQTICFKMCIILTNIETNYEG